MGWWIKDAEGNVIPKTGDFIVRMGPGLKAQIRLGQWMALTLDDRISGELFLSNQDLNHFDNTLDAQYDLFPRPRPPDDQTRQALVQERPFSEIDQRTKRDEVEMHQGVRFFLSPKFDLFRFFFQDDFRLQQSGSFVPDLSDPDGSAVYVDIASALNRERTEKRAEIGFRPRRTLRFFLSAMERETDFEKAQEKKIPPTAGLFSESKSPLRPSSPGK